MGIDVNAYRCKIGLFLPSHSTGVWKLAFHINFIILAKIIGAVSFIRILLLIAGVEQNPGPTEIYIFRYQYLLVEIGTTILRQIFDILVGKDIEKYLKNHPNKQRQLNFIISMNILNDDQKKLLPPTVRKPNSANFDIALLSCLLRNICGLRKHTDAVWNIPVPHGEFAVEADIIRLRECRNNLYHKPTVFINEGEFNILWSELSLILTRLNKFARIHDLAKRITDAGKRHIDVDLKETFDDSVRLWKEMDTLTDHGIGEVNMGMNEVKTKLIRLQSDNDQIRATLTELNKNQYENKSAKDQEMQLMQKNNQIQNQILNEIKQKMTELMERKDPYQKPGGNYEDPSDIQGDLIQKYKQTFKSRQKLENKDEFPSIQSVGDTIDDTKEIKCCEDIFCVNEKRYMELYLTGAVGVGKESFCRHLCFKWNEASGREIEQEYKYMSKFDFVFYINLRDTELHHVVDMIQESHLDHSDFKTIQSILRNYHCLIIFVHLDEWSPKIKTHKLPKRFYAERCIYLTTCVLIKRLQLANKDFDHQIHMSGLP